MLVNPILTTQFLTERKNAMTQPPSLFEQDYLNQVAEPIANNFNDIVVFATEWVKGNKTPFTSEQIRQSYEDAKLPEPKNPKVWGAVIKSLSNKNLIRFVGYGKAGKKSSHSRPISIWVQA